MLGDDTRDVTDQEKIPTGPMAGLHKVVMTRHEIHRDVSTGVWLLGNP